MMRRSRTFLNIEGSGNFDSAIVRVEPSIRIARFVASRASTAARALSNISCAARHMRSGRAILFRYYQISDTSKLPIADTGHDHQMLRPTKRPVVLAVLDNSSRQSLPNAGKFFQLFN